jgi:hypothetical protein
MDKVFSEVPDGTKFILNGTEYVKVPAVRISCCQSINATNTNNRDNRIFVQPTTMVQLNG